MCGRLRLRLRALALLLLPLLLPGGGGACGPPPPLRGARPAGPAAASYPEGADVTYECEAGLRKVPGMLQTRRCLRGSAWSALEPFCARSCSDPVRSRFAQLSHEDATKSFYPVGSTVRYVCRSAYENVSETHPTSTCLENLAWSDIPELCKRKSCGAPKGPEHGRAAVVTGFLYGDSVEITCDAGYQLTGQRLIRCQLKGDQVAWTDLPTCQLMATPPTTPKSDPPGRAATAVNSTVMVTPPAMPKSDPPGRADTAVNSTDNSLQRTPGMFTKHHNKDPQNGAAIGLGTGLLAVTVGAVMVAGIFAAKRQKKK